MTTTDTQFGDLIWDADLGWWTGMADLASGSSFTLYIHTPSEEDTSITEKAREAFVTMQASEQNIRKFAAQELLATHNDNWSDGKRITEVEFIHRLIPSAIELFPDGDAEMSFGDDDMFWGHEIGVRYRGDRLTEAVIQG